MKTIEDLISFAVQKEALRRDFYALVMEKFSVPKIKEAFAKLRDWEETHVKSLTLLKDKFSHTGKTVDILRFDLGARIPRDVNWDDFTDNETYTDILAVKFSRKIHSLEDVFKYATGFEIDSIYFFSHIRDKFNEQDKEVIDRLINAEKGHLEYLNRLKQQLV